MVSELTGYVVRANAVVLYIHTLTCLGPIQNITPLLPESLTRSQLLEHHTQ